MGNMLTKSIHDALISFDRNNKKESKELCKFTSFDLNSETFYACYLFSIFFLPWENAVSLSWPKPIEPSESHSIRLDSKIICVFRLNSVATGSLTWNHRTNPINNVQLRKKKHSINLGYVDSVTCTTCECTLSISWNLSASHLFFWKGIFETPYRTHFSVV